jgi:Leucine-rich repeat (LRR) protein
VSFNTLTIIGCTQQFSTLSFNTVADPQLSTVTSIVAQNNQIQSVPNLCSYSSILTSLDLSNNQITVLTNNIACLAKL